MPKLVPKIILEGTRLTSKTEVAFGLAECPKLVGTRKYRYHNPVISGEWCGFTNEPWGRGLINYLPEEEGQARETYETWVRLFELQRYYAWIVDRFHVSTTVYQLRAVGQCMDFDWLEKRLSSLDFRLVFLYRSPESFAEARLERLKVSGNPKQYDDLSLFVEEQEAMRNLVESSRLKTLRVDVTNCTVDQTVSSIADWMEKTGGLYLS